MKRDKKYCGVLQVKEKYIYKKVNNILEAIRKRHKKENL